MIVLTKNKGIVIPDYNDLANKPKINGVILEGNLNTEDLGISFDTSDFYTKTESDDRFQPKGDYQPAGDYLTSIPSEYVTEQWVENKGYLTSIPSEYITETELNDTLTDKNYATKTEIPTVPTNISAFNNDAGYITDNALNGYASENWVTENYQPAGNYLTSVPSEYITETELNEALAGLGGTDIPTMFIPRGYSGSVDLSILTPVVDAITNNKPWIVWGDLGAAYGRYNMIECSTMGDNSITFYDNSVFSTDGSSLVRYWTFNLTDGTFTLSERLFNFATTSYVDTQIGDINTILENIIG